MRKKWHYASSNLLWGAGFCCLGPNHYTVRAMRRGSHGQSWCPTNELKLTVRNHADVSVVLSQHIRWKSPWTNSENHERETVTVISNFEIWGGSSTAKDNENPAQMLFQRKSLLRFPSPEGIWKHSEPPKQSGIHLCHLALFLLPFYKPMLFDL